MKTLNLVLDFTQQDGPTSVRAAEAWLSGGGGAATVLESGQDEGLDLRGGLEDRALPAGGLPGRSSKKTKLATLMRMLRRSRDKLHRDQVPPWRQPSGKSMVSLVNSHTNATSKRRQLWEIDLRFALNSTPGWIHLGVFAKSLRSPLCESVSLGEQIPPKEPPQAAPPWGRSYQWLLSAGRLIESDNTDMLSTPR